MSLFRPLFCAVTIMILTACDEPVRRDSATPVSPDGFIAAAAEIDAGGLEALAATADQDPAAVADRLEGDIGGRTALRRYAAAMLDAGQAERLGRQWARLVQDRDALATAERQDGGVWHPHAEDAGFFTGGVAMVLDRNPKAVTDFAKGAALPPPAAGQDASDWLAQTARDLPRPARAAFDQAFRAAATG